MNKLSSTDILREENEKVAISIVSVLQDTDLKPSRMLLRIVMDQDGQFDVLQYGPANPTKNMTFCFRSPDNPMDVHRVEERNLRDSSDTGILERLSELMDA